ncbi:hypothetical protein HMPREF0322_05286 [Desulfitobacterium hafniense DP7]|uniref:N-acetylmuramoyl-L-alanine amidase domain-containing protein n=1 Tax=Desulfitobacterium hafniense DP7 TaxID=537010 RepID=G9XWB9_DESHA|nr:MULTISPECIES: N-acetylmuramoyl-L-alanine amidase [Desulfitobacterium]EHL03999.1 hypothetical protein HMPREF0322_05286 [Desulfitobacterium hafniense DP7]
MAHTTAGYYPGCLSWMQNPKSQVSAHYLVLRNGRILQMVKDEDTGHKSYNRPLSH